MKVAHVFDFDDTLAHSSEVIYVFPFYNGKPTEIHNIPGMKEIRSEKLEYLPDALKYSLSSFSFSKLSHLAEINNIRLLSDEERLSNGYSLLVSFEDFNQNNLEDTGSVKAIQKNITKLQKAASSSDIWILTGRATGNESSILSFIKRNAGISIPSSRIICVGADGGPTHKNKSKAFLMRILPEGPYEEIYFYDDDLRNLKEVKDVVSQFAKIYVVNSITDEVSSDAKDRVLKAKERRKEASDLRRIRSLANSNK